MIKHILVVVFILIFTSFSAPVSSQIRVACVGDSITAGWKLKEADNYVTKLGGLLGTEYEVENFGHSAYSMLKIADKSYWDSPMFQAAQDFQPHIVTIMLGTNDAHPNYWPEYEQEYIQDYLDMIKVFQGLDTKPSVIVLGLPYLKPGGRYDGVIAINGLLPGIAADAGAAFVEIWDVLLGSGLTENQLMKDPIHPSAAAHTIMAETIYPVVAAISTQCGDGVCEMDENPCSCPEDCGAPPGFELQCADSTDNDCDLQIDCGDSDCGGDPVCAPACLLDGVCGPAEDCKSCPDDCAGKGVGRPVDRFCCGDGILDRPDEADLCEGNI